MITPAFSPTATERVLPRLALDFTTASLDSRITFTRALNTATRVNSSGFIETVAANTPRFDFDPVTLACRGLLVEESRINIAPYSNAINNANWVKAQLSVTSTTVTSPEGTGNAFEITADGSSNVHTFYESVTGTAAAYTYSIYAKAGTQDFIQLRFSGALGSGKYANFNINTGTVGNFDVTSASIVNAGNGWYRCIVTSTLLAATGNIQVYFITSNTAASAESNTLSTRASFYGAQLELGSFATSYVPTTTGSVTRNADVATMTGTNFSSWWTATIGAAFAQVRQSIVTGIRSWLQFDDGTANNIIALRGNTTNPELYIKATTDQVQLDAGTIAANTAYNLVGTWNTNNCAASISAGSPVTDTSATIPTVNQLRLGSDGSIYLNGWIAEVQYWPQRLTDAEVQTFSK